MVKVTVKTWWSSSQINEKKVSTAPNTIELKGKDFKKVTFLRRLLLKLCQNYSEKYWGLCEVRLHNPLWLQSNRLVALTASVSELLVDSHCSNKYSLKLEICNLGSSGWWQLIFIERALSERLQNLHLSAEEGYLLRCRATDPKALGYSKIPLVVRACWGELFVVSQSTEDTF